MLTSAVALAACSLRVLAVLALAVLGGASLTPLPSAHLRRAWNRSFPKIRRTDSLTLERSVACRDWEVGGDEIRGRRVFTRNPNHHGGVPRHDSKIRSRLKAQLTKFS